MNAGDDDLDALMARVRTEAARRRGDRPDQAAFDLALARAAERAGPRDRWPAALRFFPFTLAPLQRVVLRWAARLGADQHAVNLALIAALRERAARDAELEARVALLEAQLARPPR